MISLKRFSISFSDWIFTIARHKITDFYRSQSRLPQHESLDRVDGHHSVNSVDKIILEKEHADELLSLLNSLPKRRREVVSLRYFGGLRNKEIAQILELDERTVASHLSRGLKDMYRAYTEKRLDYPERDYHVR